MLQLSPLKDITTKILLYLNKYTNMRKITTLITSVLVLSVGMNLNAQKKYSDQIEKYKQKWLDIVTKYYEEVLPSKKQSELEMEGIDGDSTDSA